MEKSRKWTGVSFGILFALGAPARGREVDQAVAAAQPRVGTVTSRSANPDGSYLEETGNCLLWTLEGRIYTLADLHTVMAGEEAASQRVADQIVVTVGKRSSPARLVWPPEGRRDVLQVDIAILELQDGSVGGQPFTPEAFQALTADLPKDLYLAAPGHRSRILALEAPAVRYGPQWFLYRELSPGDSGGMVFALENGRVVPYGFVSAIGSLPGESTRGTVVYGRDAMRIFINQFLRSRSQVASQR
ncbi:MAG TPA: hypothetical protein VIZ31_03245 [Vicinamibacteria bacterium]